MAGYIVSGGALMHCMIPTSSIMIASLAPECFCLLFCIRLLILATWRANYAAPCNGPLWPTSLDDYACAQDTDDKAVPTDLDHYDTPERFKMVSLYCVLSYMPVYTCCAPVALKPYHFFTEPLLCVQIQLQLTQRLYDSMIHFTKYCHN